MTWRALALALGVPLVGCRAPAPLESSRVAPRPSASTAQITPSAEPLRLSSALFATRMTAEELGGHGPTLSQEQRSAAFLTSAALLLIDSSTAPAPAKAAGAGADEPTEHFEGYFMVAREAAFGIVKEQPLPKPLPVALLYGASWPPCFGTAKQRATLEASNDAERTDALIVEDCLRPGSIYAGVALLGGSSEGVRVLVDAATLAHANVPPYDLANMNALLRRAGKTQQYGTDRRFESRDEPSLRAAREAAEALPEVQGAQAKYVVEQGGRRSFVFELPNATGGPGKLELVEVSSEGKALVKSAELR